MVVVVMVVAMGRMRRVARMKLMLVVMMLEGGRDQGHAVGAAIEPRGICGTRGRGRGRELLLHQRGRELLFHKRRRCGCRRHHGDGELLA